MERFIDKTNTIIKKLNMNLKSSMERFIALFIVLLDAFPTFKIQYGEIYSVLKNSCTIIYFYLKSSMERFIVNHKLEAFCLFVI